MNDSFKLRNPFRSIATIFLFLLISLIPVIPALAQKIQPRLNQGAVLEPQGKIINGAGQDLPAFNNYWNVMHTQTKPVIYMTYVGLKSVTSDWADGLKAELMSHSGKFLVAQIGLNMTTDGTPATHYEQDVAAGLLDKQITMFIDGLEAMAIPAYVRIGYEFNGVAWNGYQAETYKQAFIRMTNMIRARGIEVATVWDFAMDGVMNYMDYYPGDNYVDWWAINVFSKGHLTNANAYAFIQAAGNHKKPVMIGETTPREVGVLDGQLSWNNWFAPFFALIHNYPQIKAFSYINWDWSQYPQWSTWGDARLEKNTIVSAAFASEMDSLQYLHASSESDFRKTLGFSDNTAPAVPGNLSAVQSGFPLKLNWNSVTDPSGLSHYIIYKHGVLADYTLTLPYTDKNVAAGDTITYAVSAMDRAGNESQRSPGLKVSVPSPLSKAMNGEFDNGTKDWVLASFSTDAAGTMEIDSSSVISGRKSCAITISKVSGTDWHLQLRQWLPLTAKHRYAITFKAKASANKTITLAVQKDASPYTIYLSKVHTLSTTLQTFTDTVTINTSDLARLNFYIGSAGTTKIWIDAVTIVESSTLKQTPAISMTTLKALGSSYSFKLTSYKDNTPLQVDFGNGTLVDKMIFTGMNNLISGTLAGTQNVKVYGPGISVLECNNSQVTALDISNNPELLTLSCTGNRLTTLNVSANTSLLGLSCDNNLLTTIDVSKNTELQGLICDNNQLNTLDVSKNTALIGLSCSKNQLTTLDVTKNLALTNISAASNMLSSLDLSKNTALSNLTIHANKFTLATLPLGKSLQGYSYAPQSAVQIVKSILTGTDIDLSSQLNIDGKTTQYTWKTVGGTTLVPGTDYMLSNGKTKFLKEQADSVYCEMANATFPYFTNANVFKTTNTKVSLNTGLVNPDMPEVQLYVLNKILFIKSPFSGQATIFDVTGKRVAAREISVGSNSIALQQEGVFLVRISGGRSAFVRKVVVGN